MAEKPLTRLGELLKALRKQHRYSVKQLEKDTGVSGSYINLLEHGYDKRTGKTIRPSREILMQLGHALGGQEAALMIAAGYLPEEIAASVAEEGNNHPLAARRPLSPQVIEELKDVLAQAVLEVLRRKGLIE